MSKRSVINPLTDGTGWLRVYRLPIIIDLPVERGKKNTTTPAMGGCHRLPQKKKKKRNE